MEEIKIPMKSKDLFLLYTDGMTEAMNESRQEFGEEALVNRLKSVSTLQTREIQQDLLRTVDQFRGSAEQHDDVTMVVVKVQEKNKR